jgi:hypothetical protein
MLMVRTDRMRAFIVSIGDPSRIEEGFVPLL